MAYIPLIAKVDSLPPLPESVLKIETLFTKGDPDIDDIVAIIQKDPILTADILAKVNAPYYGFSKSIVSILQAVTLFGSTQIRSIVLSSSINRSFDIDISPYNITTSDFAQISSMQSELTFQWYMRVNIDIARTITPIAFLMETGKILISKEIIQTHKTLEFQRDIETFEDIFFVENKYTMMTTAQINALVFQHFNLNDSFIEVMQYLDAEREIPEHVFLMVTVLRAIKIAINTKEQLTSNSIGDALEFLEKNSLEIEPFRKAITYVRNKFSL